MNKKEIAQQFTKQMLDQNAPSINFEQVTKMLKETEQTYKEVISNIWKVTDLAQTLGLFVFSPSFAAGIFKEANRSDLH